MTLIARVEAAVRERGGDPTKLESEFRCPQPERHANGDEHKSARWNSAKKVWYCPVCNDGGGYRDLAQRLGLLDHEQHGDHDRRRQGPARRRTAAIYDYADANGVLLYQVVRFEQPKTFRQRRARHPDDDVAALTAHKITVDKEWVWSLDRLEPAPGEKCQKCGGPHRVVQVRRVLYPLPQLLAADPALPVYVVEGEKDVDALLGLGLVATTNPQGAGKWRPEYDEHLRDRDVVLLPDHDVAGRDHAEMVARNLAGVARTVRIVDLPDLPEKGDVSDWIAAGGTREALEALVAAAPSAGAGPNGTATTPTGTPPPAKVSQATLLLELATDLELFHAPDADPAAYCRVAVDDHHEVYRIPSRAVRALLARRFYREHRKAVRGQSLAEAVAMLEARALMEGDAHPVATRIAEHGGAIYLDLCDPGWRVVEVTAEGWHVVTDAPVRFRRARGMLALPEPISGGSLERLREFLHVDDDGWRLALAWLLAALRPRGPYPVLALHGEHGTTKSTATRVLRSLVDPNVAPLRSEPREPRDLIIAATNGWAIALDNVSALPVWLSDALCRLSTGGGFSTRELYTDAEETLFDAMRPVLINGIEEVATRGDLADRAVVVTLAPVAETDRMTEEEFGAAFEGARAGILGALLEVVSGGLRELPRTRLDRLPRMADFARWVTACEAALGWEAGAFVRTYTDARRAATEATLEASAVATAVLAFVRAGGDWTGTAAELLAGLEAHVPEALRRDRMRWPHSARGLSGALRRLGPALRAVGVDVEHLPRRHGGARPLCVARVRGEDTTVTTVTTVPEPVSPGPAGDGRADGGEKPSPPPSPKNASNGAGGDDGDDGDGPIPTSHGWGEV